MSRVESPFHAIAAEALDDDIPDVPDVEVEVEVKVNGSAAATDVVAITSPDAKGQEGDVVKPALESNIENWDNAADAAEGKNGGGPEQEAEQTPEQTPVHQEQKVSSEGGGAEVSEAVTKKSKKRTNVWTKTTSRKSTKKVKNNGVRQTDGKDDNVLLKPFHQEDDPSYPILLSKIYKAEKIELSTDRLTASGSKGYRMVRATRGVVEGAWYFEIYVDRLGATGHTRMGWSTRRGDIQAPVGYDAHSYSYRDLDGSKVHAALREDYGEAYHEKDVLGFYINLSREAGFTPKPEEEVVGYKGQPYIIVADEPLKPLPGSEMLFFKNGVCQGLAFKDLNDGTYFPAASMYTLPSQDCCRVVFNFGPDFKYPVTDLGDRPLPSPMCQASGPGEAKAETVSAIQADEVLESMDNGGGKRMAPEVGDAMEVEEATTATKEENTSKEVEKVPIVAKMKVKKPRIPVGNTVPPFLSKKPKVGGVLLHPESKKDADLKSFKSDAARLGVVSTVLPSQKGSKKDPLGTGLPNPKGLQKVKGLLVQKGIQKDKGSSNLKIQKVKGLSNLKGLQKDNGLPSVKGSKKPLSGTGTPRAKNVKQDVSVPVTSVKGTGLPGSKGFKKVGTGLPNFKESKKDVPVMGSQNFHGSKKDSTVGGFQSGKGTKRDTSGLGLPKPKKMKKDLTGIGLALITSKGFTGTGSALKASKKDLPGTGSLLKASKNDSLGTGSALKTSKKDLPGTGFIHKPSKKDFAGSGHLPKGLGPTAFSGGRSWADGISGQAIDVVVVESSTPTQGAGPFR